MGIALAYIYIAVVISLVIYVVTTLGRIARTQARLVLAVERIEKQLRGNSVGA
jgi:hypothetical protein